MVCILALELFPIHCSNAAGMAYVYHAHTSSTNVKMSFSHKTHNWRKVEQTKNKRAFAAVWKKSLEA